MSSASAPCSSARRHLWVRGLLVLGCGAAVGLACGWGGLWPLAGCALLVWAGQLRAVARCAHHALLLTALGLCAWSLAAMAWTVIPVRQDAPWRPLLQAGLLTLVLLHHLGCAWPGWIAGRMLLRRCPAQVQVLLAWVLALASAEALRPLGWWGHGYGALATALVDAPGSGLLLPWLGGLGWATLCLSLCAGLIQLLPATDRTHRLLPLGGGLLAGGLSAWCLASAPGAAAGPLSPPSTDDAVTVLALSTERNRAAPWTAADRDGAMDRLLQGLDRLPAGGVLATAETYLPQSAPESPLGAWGDLLDAVATRQVDVLLGMPQWVQVGDAPPYPVNAVRHLAPTRQAVYGKARLVPLGEYLPDLPWSRPLARWLFASAQGEQPAPPEMQEPLFVSGHPVGVLICHELSLPDLTRTRALASDWLLVAADDSWVGRKDYLGQMRSMLRLRALETGRPILRVASGGPSLLALPDGQVQTAAPGQGPMGRPVRFLAPPTPGASALRLGPWIAGLPLLLLVTLLGRAGATSPRRQPACPSPRSPLQELPHADAS